MSSLTPAETYQQSIPIEPNEENQSNAPQQSKWVTYSWILILILGQFIAILNAGTAVFSKLLTERDISLPFCQSLLNYILLNIFWFPLALSRWITYKSTHTNKKSIPTNDLQQPLITNDNDDYTTTETTTEIESLIQSSSSTSLNSTPIDTLYIHSTKELTWTDIYSITFAPRHAKLWFYLLISILDVQGNFLIVKAYKYTSMLAVQLIDSANLPFVLFFSWIFLSKKFSNKQLIACGLSLIGLIMCIATDTYIEYHKHRPQQKQSEFFALATNDDLISYKALFGDFLVLAACTCYSLSNIIQEAVLTDTVDTSSFKINNILPRQQQQQQQEQLQQSQSQSNIQQQSDTEISTIDLSTTNNPSQSIPSQLSDLQPNSNTSQSTSQSTSQLQSTPKPITIQWDRTMEYLAFLGLCGTLLGSLEGLIFEHNGLHTVIARGALSNSRVWLYIFGYTCSIFCMYLFMPILIQNSGAVVLNLSLLMTDVYSAIAAFFFFDQIISWFYIFAFAIIGSGLILYNFKGSEHFDPDQDDDIYEEQLVADFIGDNDINQNSTNNSPNSSLPLPISEPGAISEPEMVFVVVDNE